MKFHSHAEAMGIQTRSDAWRWVASQANSHSPDPHWLRADLVGNIGVTPPMIFGRIGMRRYPPYVHPQMDREMIDPWTFARLRRMESDHWELAPQPNLQRN